MKRNTVANTVADKKDRGPELWVQECVIISLREENLVRRLPELQIAWGWSETERADLPCRTLLSPLAFQSDLLGCRRDLVGRLLAYPVKGFVLRLQHGIKQQDGVFL